MAIQQVKKSIITGSTLVFFGKTGTAIAGLASNALLARLLDPEEMGAYFLTLSIVTLTALIAQLGLMRTIVRLIAESLGTEQPGRARSAIIKTLTIGACSALVVSTAYLCAGGHWLAVSLFDSVHMSRVVALSALWIFVLTFQNITAEIFRGFNDILKATLFSGLIRSTVSASLFAGIWIAYGSSDIKQVVLLSVVAGSTGVFLAGYFLSIRLKRLEGPGDIKYRQVLSIALPLWIMVLSVYLVNNADLWVLGAFRPKAEVAIYGAVKKIIMLFIMPLTVINGVVQPLVAEMHARGKLFDIEDTIRRTAGFAAIPAFISLVVFFLAGKMILGTIFGDFYRSGYVIFLILSVGNLVNAWSGSCAVVMIMTGHQKAAMLINLSCGTIAIIGAIAIVPHYNSTGVAVVNAACLALQNFLMIYATKFFLGVKTYMKWPGDFRTMAAFVMSRNMSRSSRAD